MGLAQKLAAVQAAQSAQGGGGYGPPPQQYHAYHPLQNPESYYWGPPPPPSPPYQQQHYSSFREWRKQIFDRSTEQAPDRFAKYQFASGPQDVGQYVRQLEEARLQSFWKRETALRASQEMDEFVAAWYHPRETAVDMARHALKDDLIYNDDSGYMALEEKGKRVKDLELAMQRAALDADLLYDYGIETCFTNDDAFSPGMLENIRTEQLIAQVMASRKYKGLTPFGTKLRQKVIDGIVLPKLRSPMPVLDTERDRYTGLDAWALGDNIRYAVNASHNLCTGTGAFQCLSTSPFGPPVDSDQNQRTWPKRPDDPEDYRLDPWVVKSILDTIGPIYSIYKPPANPYSSRGLAYDPGRPHLTSTLEKSHDGWALLDHVHNILGFGRSQVRALNHLCDADTWSGAAWARCKSNAMSVLKGAYGLVDKFSSRTLTTACLLGGLPYVSGAPLSPGEAMLAATHDFESFMDGLGIFVVAVAPLAIWVGTAARLWYILRWPTRELAHPIYSGALATMAGFTYWVVRQATEESASKEALILAWFVACWTSFVADSRRRVNNKELYFLLVMFGGGAVCLLGTALQYLDQESHRVARQTGSAPINQAAEGGQSFEPGALGPREATAYLTLAKTNGPLLLIVTSVVVYIWQSYFEVGPE